MIDIGLLAGGSAWEREVSMASVKEILENINKSKYNVRVITIPEDGGVGWVRELMDNPPELVLSGLHGGIGEDGSVQGLLECLGIAYVGSKVMSSAISMDKAMTKLVLQSNNIPVAKGVLLARGEDIIHFDTDIIDMGFPLVVKPNHGGSSLGISIAHDRTGLVLAIEKVKVVYPDDDILIEKFISGREITCGVIERKSGCFVLPVLDIATESDFYDYDAKYHDRNTKIEFSTLPEFQQTMIKEVAKKAFACLGCLGYGRVDMIVNEEQLYVIEMNTLPGLTAHSLIPKAVAKAGFSFGDFLDEVIEFALGRGIARP